jgi:hypothetical protein
MACRRPFSHRAIVDLDRKSYGAIHTWLNRQNPRTGRCEWCARTTRKTHYASASHARYTYNRADWLELCVPCHRAFDGWKPSPHTAQSRAKLSLALRGNKNGVGNTNRLGAKVSAETRAKLSAAAKAQWAARA